MKHTLAPTILNNFNALKAYNKPRSQVAHEITKFPHISDTSGLSAYFLLYATPTHFKLNQHEGIYFRLNEETNTLESYIILYNNCTRLEAINSTHQLKLSFRSPKPEYNLPDYVMVTK